MLFQKIEISIIFQLLFRLSFDYFLNIFRQFLEYFLTIFQVFFNYLSTISTIFSFAQQNYINVVVCLSVCVSQLHFHQKVQLQQCRAAEQLLNIVVFRNYFTLEFFRLFFNFTSFLSKNPAAAEQSS